MDNNDIARFDILAKALQKSVDDIRNELTPWKPVIYTASGNCVRQYGTQSQYGISLQFSDDFVEPGSQLPGFEAFTGTSHRGLAADFLVERIQIEVAEPDAWEVMNFYIGQMMMWTLSTSDKGLPGRPFVDGFDLSTRTPPDKRLAHKGVTMTMSLRYLGKELSVPVKATVIGRARAS